MTINERIRQAVAASGMKQKDVAAACCVSSAHVSMVCSGAAAPGDRMIRDLCAVLNVSETWLRTGEGEMKAYAEKNDRLAELVARLGRPKAETTLRIVSTVLSAVDDETAQRIWDAFMLEAQRMIRENEKESGGE